MEVDNLWIALRSDTHTAPTPLASHCMSDHELIADVAIETWHLMHLK